MGYKRCIVKSYEGQLVLISISAFYCAIILCTTHCTGLVAVMDSFALDNKQTLVLRLTVPDDSLTWGLSICPEDHEDFKYVLYHFNPRKKEKGGILVQNDRIDAHWNQAGNAM
jgi:hypothetical protein